MNQSCVDYISHLEDEIALEGLDGITVEALWQRLSKRHNFLENIALDDNSKNFLWTLVIQDEEIEFFCLNDARPPLNIFNRYEYIDNELGIIYEPNENFEDVYPCTPVDDPVKGVRGSCSTYNTRVNITDEVIGLSLTEALEKYENRLVLVASQTLRNKALSINAAIDKLYDLKLMQYVMLERIGRSRTLGEITYGKNSLSVMNVPPKSLFYYRKRLLKLNLITKQSHRQRSTKGNISSSSLLHLTRFYVVRRPKFLVVIRRVLEILKSKPDNISPIDNIKEEIGFQNVSSKRIFKSSDFVKYVQTLFVPYRQIYKDAKAEQWKYKSKNEEKTVRCLKLVNPNINPDDLFLAEDDDDEVDEFESLPGILNQSNLAWGKNLLYQAYSLIEVAGPNGLSQLELSKQLGLTKLDSRTVCRNLQKRNVIHSLMKDIGRQRVSRFVSNKFASTGHLLQEFEKERKKMIEIVGESSSSKLDEEDQIIQYQASTPSTSRIMESDVIGDLEIDLEMTHSGSKTSATVSEPMKSDGRGSAESGGAGNEPGCMVITLGEPVEDDGSSFSIDTQGITNSRPVNQKKASPHLTTRMIKRANIIMKAVRQHKVIDDSFKLQKLILNSEEAEGVEAKMDKKSLTRLLDRLSRSGYLKKIVVKIQAHSKTKLSTFVVDPSVTLENNLLKLAIEQEKHKFLVQASSSHLKKDLEGKCQKETQSKPSDSEKPASTETEEPKDKKEGDASVGASVLELEKMHVSKAANKKTTENSELEVKSIGIKGNVAPKFVRMQEFHKLLFYLVYGYEGQIELDSEETWKKVVASSTHDISQENPQDYPTIYFPEISWKMFIPPLPRHPTVNVDGWIFVVDILLRLPLCIFCQLVNISNYPSKLTSYLNHPIKQNLLVKSLPPELRRTLFNGRRYVTYVMELCRRLSFVGLLQHGKQVMKEKDQIFVYLNRRATLVDTTTSSPGYHHISLDKEYVRKEYTFYTIQDVIQYWYDMWTICMHTPLGAHMCVQGKKITIQVLNRKPEMIESLEPRNIEEAPLRDDGRIPGDKKGAAGLDSAMYSHLKRNWSCLYPKFSSISQSSAHNNDSGESKSSSFDSMFSYAQYLRNSCSPGSVDKSVSKSKLAGLRNVRLSLYKPKGETDVGKALPISVGLVDSKKKRRKDSEKSAKTTKDPTKGPRKIVKAKDKASFQREIKARFKVPKKPYYDEEDKAALRRMNKLRVDWYPAEDAFLLLCKVSSAYLFPNKRTQVINFSVVRDLLHSRYPESRNKTSRACQRRINYILKNPATEENVAVILEELKQDEEITREFKPAKLNYKLTMLHKLYVGVFKELVSRLVSKYASNESKDVPDLPNSYEEFKYNFKIIRASKSLRQGPKLKELSSVYDVDYYVVNALIFSSLCTKQDRESWAYQLYLAYQKYPQKLLNSVLTSIRDSKMISYKKCYNRSKHIRNCLPLSTSPFQLSLSFIYLFHMKYQYELFGDCWEFMKKLLEEKRKSMLQSSALKSPEEILESTIKDKLALGNSESDKLETPPAKPKRKRRMKKVGARSKSNKASREAKILERKIAKQDKEKMEELSTKSGEGDENKNENDDDATPKIVESVDESNADQNERPLEGETEGLKISVNAEGGCCAAVISLAALDRIVFDITIPDQMIVIDNIQGEKLERQDRLLEVVKNHELRSGRKFTLPEGLDASGLSCDEDIYADNQDDSRTMEVDELDGGSTQQESVQKNLNIPLNDEETMDLDGDKTTEFYANSDSCKRKYMALESEDEGASVKKIKADYNPNMFLDPFAVDRQEEYSSDQYYSKDKDPLRETSNKPQKPTQSRVRMYIIREQMPDSVLSNSPGAMDNFFINTCDITCSLKFPSGSDVPSVFSSFEEIYKLLMPVSQDTINHALSMRKKILLQNWIRLGPALDIWREEGRSPEFLNAVETMYNFIDSKKEIGPTARDIKRNFQKEIIDMHPLKIIREMEDMNLIIRAGVETFRWVTIQHSKAWLIRTNKMSRGKMNSTESVRLSGVYDVKDTEEEVDKEKEAIEEPTEANKETEASDEIEAKTDEGNKGEDIEQPSTSSNTKSKRTSSRKPKITLLKKSTKHDSEVAEKLEKSVDPHTVSAQYEEIDVLVRPWVRLNGCLNRRVMDRMLGSVLCYVIENPGIKVCQITKRFWPALQPAHTLELLETLLSLGAVKRAYVRIEPISLFSERQNIRTEIPEECDFDDDMSYEADVDAVLKLAAFIGDKKYTLDFLSVCR